MNWISINWRHVNLVGHQFGNWILFKSRLYPKVNMCVTLAHSVTVSASKNIDRLSERNGRVLYVRLAPWIDLPPPPALKLRGSQMEFTLKCAHLNWKVPVGATSLWTIHGPFPRNRVRLVRTPLPQQINLWPQTVLVHSSSQILIKCKFKTI